MTKEQFLEENGFVLGDIITDKLLLMLEAYASHREQLAVRKALKRADQYHYEANGFDLGLKSLEQEIISKLKNEKG